MQLFRKKDQYDYIYGGGIGPVKAFFIVLGILVLIVGGWLLYRFLTGEPITAFIPIHAPHVTPPPTSATYTDKAGVYTLTYPVQRWNVAAQTAINISIPLPPIDGHVVSFLPVDPSDAGFGAAGQFYAMAFNASPVTILTDARHGTVQSTPRSLTINGYPALYQQDSSNIQTTFTDDEYAVYHNGVTVYFTFREQQGPSLDDDGFDATGYLNDYQSIVDSIRFHN